jgi:hypothetical protein
MKLILALPLILALVPSLATSQELNKRANAPPADQATVGRLIPKARVQAAEEGKDLGKDIVNTDCSPLQIGNVQPEKNAPLPRDNAVVVQGNIVNICK